MINNVKSIGVSFKDTKTIFFSKKLLKVIMDDLSLSFRGSRALSI